jgi:hypothetical protein
MRLAATRLERASDDQYGTIRSKRGAAAVSLGNDVWTIE